jgi:hypothetical protein
MALKGPSKTSMLFKETFYSSSIRLSVNCQRRERYLSIVFRVSRRGPRNCGSLALARDDKKEGATVHKEWSALDGFSP